MTPLPLPSFRESEKTITSGEGLNDTAVVVSVSGPDRLHCVPELVEHESPGVLDLVRVNVVRATLTVLRSSLVQRLQVWDFKDLRMNRFFSVVCSENSQGPNSRLNRVDFHNFQRKIARITKLRNAESEHRILTLCPGSRNSGDRILNPVLGTSCLTRTAFNGEGK